MYSSKEKDELEGEVGRCVKLCGQQIERLKQSVLAAQQQQQTSGQAAAHLHGMVRHVFIVHSRTQWLGWLPWIKCSSAWQLSCPSPVLG